ncbi:MAG: hypothetical protein WHV28_00460 [Bacteroidota bacterium]
MAYQKRNRKIQISLLLTNYAIVAFCVETHPVPTNNRLTIPVAFGQIVIVQKEKRHFKRASSLIS